MNVWQTLADDHNDLNDDDDDVDDDDDHDDDDNVEDEADDDDDNDLKSNERFQIRPATSWSNLRRHLHDRFQFSS